MTDQSDKIYYSGMAGPDATVASVESRHVDRSAADGSSPGRFDPEKGDKLLPTATDQTYGDARRLEHQTAVDNGTIVGRDGQNYRGNRQRPIGQNNADKYYEEGEYPCPK
jgi:hypothetical protein